jgi:phosphatidylserine decarboxylase
MRAHVLRRFASCYGIDVSEAELELAQYGSLQEFFTRRLRPGLRPVDPSPAAVVSPADGLVCDSGTVCAGRLLEAKGSPFTLRDLLADDELAARLEGGPFLVTYLSPRDYHRVHSPVPGRIAGWTHIPGRLFPVGRRSVAREPGLFARNERFVTVIEGPAGVTALVMVAAVGVGHITASYDPEVATHGGGFSTGEVRHRRFAQPPAIEAGQEVGVFNLGSTTIAVFEPGRVAMDSLPAEAELKMGQSVGRIVPPEASGAS